MVGVAADGRFVESIVAASFLQRSKMKYDHVSQNSVSEALDCKLSLADRRVTLARQTKIYTNVDPNICRETNECKQWKVRNGVLAQRHHIAGAHQGGCENIGDPEK